MSTPVSPLQLKGYDFTRLRVQAVPDGSAKNRPELVPKVRFERVEGQERQWHLLLEVLVRSLDPRQPFHYEIEAAVQGLVEVHDEFPAERRESLAVVNGLGLLYGAVREMVANVTARSVHGILTLPALNFVEVVKQATDEAASKATRVAPPPGPAPRRTARKP